MNMLVKADEDLCFLSLAVTSGPCVQMLGKSPMLDGIDFPANIQIYIFENLHISKFWSIYYCNAIS